MEKNSYLLDSSKSKVALENLTHLVEFEKFVLFGSECKVKT